MKNTAESGLGGVSMGGVEELMTRSRAPDRCCRCPSKHTHPTGSPLTLPQIGWNQRLPLYPGAGDGYRDHSVTIIETRARSRWNPETVVQRHRTVMSGPDRNAFGIKHLGEIVRVNVLQAKGGHSALMSGASPIKS